MSKAVLSRGEMFEIYTRSLSLRELVTSYPFLTWKEDQDMQEDRSARWCQVIAQGDRGNFEKRFIWSGISMEQVNNLLGKWTLAGDLSLPGWIRTLDECLRKTDKHDERLEDIAASVVSDKDGPYPFEEILRQFVDYARDELKRKLSTTCNIVTEAAHMCLERYLLQWLCSLHSMTLELEYAVFRASCQPRLKRGAHFMKEASSRIYYDRFVRSFQEGRLIEYCKEYAVLARLTAIGVEQWIQAMSEMIFRLKKDTIELEKVFNSGRQLGPVIDMKTSLSDRHNNGRSVMVLTFESGVKVVYKPRPLGIEQAYNDLIVGMAAMGAPLQLKAFSVIDRGEYGWAEWISGSRITDSKGDRAYYKKAGAVLCIAYVLGATDLHYENIIRHGTDPVIIDLETLLHPFANDEHIEEDGKKAYRIAAQFLVDSVLRTGLLPYWNIEEDGQAYDLSGLGEFMPQQFNVDGRRWEGLNTDQMRIRKERVNVYQRESDPGSGNDSAGLHHFSADIVRGFTQVYNFLCDKRDLILSAAFWQALSRQTIRFVFRPTHIYALIQRKLLDPCLLRSGVERSIYLDVLYKGKTIGDRPPSWWPLIEAEQEAMEKMDIPHFTARTNSAHIELEGGKIIEAYFKEPSFDTASNRLKQLSDRNLGKQVDFIKEALACRVAEKNHFVTEARRSRLPVKSGLLTEEMALAQGSLIAAMLKEKAIIAEDGSITWVAPKYYPVAQRYQLEPNPDCLYDGNSGIALFFAALFKLTGREEHREMAMGTLQIPIANISGLNISIHSIGGIAGYGSYIYSFFKAGVLLNEPKLIAASKRAAAQLTRAIIGQDSSLDVIYGAAGIILSLLQLYEHSGDPDLLELLSCAGDHLLDHRDMTCSGFKAWRSGKHLFPTGFSHGVAGMAYALLRLYKVTHCTAYLDAAVEAIAYENSTFNAKENNWPDYREEKGGIFMSSWCHGASGIGLARIATLDILDTKEVRNDIDSALQTSKKYLSPTMDHVCCGNLGRLELLLTASLKYDDRQLHHFTLQKAGEIVVRAKADNGFQYNPLIGFMPGFFQGVSGIGYQLLRLAFPQSLSSVLLLN